MAELGNEVAVEAAVKHGSDLEHPQAAFKNLNNDLTQAENSMSRQDYGNYLEQVRIGLIKSGALPDLAITWAQEKVKNGGALTREQLVEEASAKSSGSATKESQGMNSTFAKEVVLNFDTFKNANFDRDTYGQEKDFITGADVEQVRRHQNFYREKEADLNAYVALAYDHRDDHEKRLLDRIDRDSHTTLQSGEGLWDVASRVLKQGGFASDGEHVSKYADDLARLNVGKKMEPGTDLLLTHADIQATLYDVGMKGYGAHEDARFYNHRKAYVLRSEIIGFDIRRPEPQTSSWGAE